MRAFGRVNLVMPRMANRGCRHGSPAEFDIVADDEVSAQDGSSRGADPRAMAGRFANENDEWGAPCARYGQSVGSGPRMSAVRGRRCQTVGCPGSTKPSLRRALRNFNS